MKKKLTVMTAAIFSISTMPTIINSTYTKDSVRDTYFYIKTQDTNFGLYGWDHTNHLEIYDLTLATGLTDWESFRKDYNYFAYNGYHALDIGWYTLYDIWGPVPGEHDSLIYLYNVENLSQYNPDNYYIQDIFSYGAYWYNDSETGALMFVVDCFSAIEAYSADINLDNEAKFWQ